MPDPSILGIGSAHIDLFIQVNDAVFSHYASQKSRHIDLDDFLSLIRLESPIVLPGGSAANTIRGLAHLGEKCAFLSCVGDDQEGAFFLDNLEKLGIHSHVSVVAGFSTIQLICMINSDGEKRIIYPKQQEPRISFKKSHFENVELTHIDSFQFEIGNDLEKAMELSHCKISFNLGNRETAEKYREKILLFLRKHADIVFGNEEEIEALTGLPSERGCMRLQQLGLIAVMTRGKKGCFIAHENGCLSVPGYPAKMVDATGAGDLFASGFLFGYLRGRPLVRCAAMGNLLGAAIVEVIGTEIPESKWESLRRELR